MSKREYFVFKMDFQKAYDSVSWYFLDYMLKRFRFDDRLMAWINNCVFSRSLLVLMNGYPDNEISIHKGIKQGYPLYPFLFLQGWWKVLVLLLKG